jgi:hypothetical protein
MKEQREQSASVPRGVNENERIYWKTSELPFLI